MKIGDRSVSANFQPENIQETPAGAQEIQTQQPPATLDSLEGPTGQTRQALSGEPPADQHDNTTTDWINGTALLVGAGAATYGIGLPFAAMLADFNLPERVGDWTDSAFDWLGNGIGAAGHELGGAFGDALDWLGGAVMNTPEAFGEAVVWTGDAIGDAGEWLGDGFSDAADALGDAELDAIDAASDGIDAAGDAIDSVGDAVSDAVSTVTDW